MNDELMERLARAWCLQGATMEHDVRLSEMTTEEVHSFIQAILSELSAAGFVAVPEVPTEEMVDIGTDILCERGCNPVSDDAVAVFSAMLRARPKI